MTTQKSFLFATFEGGGSVTPMLGVVRDLVQRGHRVRVMSDACNRPESEAAGANFVPYARAPSKPERTREFDTWDDWSQPNPQDGFLNLVDNLLVGAALACAEDVIEELGREPADLVVSSEMLFGPALACEALGQRHALLAVNVPLFPMDGFVPLGPGLAPPRTPQDHAMHDAVRQGMRDLMNSRLPVLNAARAKLGLKPLTDFSQQHDKAERLFLATARAFDFAPDILPPKLHYVGPLLVEPSWAKPWASPFRPDDARPLALVSFSTTFQNHAGVLQNVIDAIAGAPAKAIVTLGGAIRPDELRGAENVVIVDGAPHGAILKDAALAITHGGHGTVMKALAAQKPLLILPHGRDQEDNATRVTHRGAGLRIDRTASAEDIRTALLRLVADPSFTICAEQLGAAIQREVKASRLLDMLERLAERRSGGGQTGAAAMLATAS